MLPKRGLFLPSLDSLLLDIGLPPSHGETNHLYFQRKVLVGLTLPPAPRGVT